MIRLSYWKSCLGEAASIQSDWKEERDGRFSHFGRFSLLYYTFHTALFRPQSAFSVNSDSPSRCLSLPWNNESHRWGSAGWSCAASNTHSLDSAARAAADCPVVSRFAHTCKHAHSISTCCHLTHLQGWKLLLW